MFAFVGVVIGTVTGAASAWRDWHPLKAFAAALALAVGVMLVPDLGAKLDLESMLGVVLLGPLIGFLPTGAGFVVAHRFVSLAFPKS